MSSEIAGTTSPVDKSKPPTEKVLGSTRKMTEAEIDKEVNQAVDTAIKVRDEYLFLVEVVNTTEPSEVEFKYLPMKKIDPFAVLMYKRLKKWHKKPISMDYTLWGCDRDGNEGDGERFVEELTSEEEIIFRRAPCDPTRKMRRKKVNDDDEDDDEEENDHDPDNYEVELNSEWVKMMDAACDSIMTPHQARTVYGQLPWVRIIVSQD